MKKTAVSRTDEDLFFNDAFKDARGLDRPGVGFDQDWPQLVLVRREPGTPPERLSSGALEIARNVARRCGQVLLLPGQTEAWIDGELASRGTRLGDPGEPACFFDEPGAGRSDRVEHLRNRCLAQRTRFLLVDNLARLEPQVGQEALGDGLGDELVREVFGDLHDTFRCFAMVIAVLHPFREAEAEQLLSEGWVHHVEPALGHGE